MAARDTDANLRNRLDPDGHCGQCGQRHVTKRGAVACAGHVTKHRADANGYRAPLDQPRPCTKDPMRGQAVCRSHGGAKGAAKAAGERRETERAMTEAARKLIPDLAERTVITNPLETLLELASEAHAFRESLRIMANKIEGNIRYAAGGGSGEQLRAEVSTYRQALKDTTDILVQIARLDIEKMLARIEARKAEAAIVAMRAGLDEAGVDEQQQRKVMAGVGRHLRAVAS